MSTDRHHKSPSGVAIIGMEARLPGARNLDAFWRNLRDGVESITFFSDKAPVIRNGLGRVRAAPLMDDVELFDAAFFGFSPREAETMDPQVRVFLEGSWAALESAGYDAQQYDGRIGVFAGCAPSSYLMINLLSNPDVMRASGGGFSSLGQFNDRDSLATIVSYKFDLGGPSITVQTFCSTSLVAVHLACQSLLNAESDVALAGGVSINVASHYGYVFQEGGIMSPDGHCRTFDAKARGTVFGNGMGIVVLKRLADALADGDTIHAVIKSSAINNDGSRKAGYTAPSVGGQAKVIAEAIALARISPDTISYVEAHGTGTEMGDPIEIEALTRAFRLGTEKKCFCRIGSVKTNMGHLDRAAGMAGLLKTVLALEHRQIPPSLHFESPNPKIDFENSPFVVNAKLTDWDVGAAPRRAGVSALGVGGTNAHLILEEAPAPDRPQDRDTSPQLIVLSAKTEDALNQCTGNLVEYLKANPDENFADVAYTLQKGRRRFEHRRAVACRDAQEAVEIIQALPQKRVVTQRQQASDRPIVFMFPGQGAQYVGMTQGLYRSQPVYKEWLDRCCEATIGPLGFDLREVLFAEQGARESATERLTQTAVTQPALFAVEYALVKLLEQWGVKPEAMIGHSIGEYVAATLAGVFTLEDALALVAKRAQLMQAQPAGRMLAVFLPADQIEPFVGGQVSLAAINAPSLSVLSGPGDAIGAIEERLGAEGLPCRALHTSHAFHSPAMDPILEEFTACVDAVHRKEPGIPYVSNLSGTWIEKGEATDPTYWAKHMRYAVRFSAGIQALWAEPKRVLLEVGPGNTLSALARQHVDRTSDHVALPTIRHPDDSTGDPEFLLGAVGHMWAAGVTMDWSAIHDGHPRRRKPLPTYPFDRKKYWIEARPVADTQSKASVASRRQSLKDWFYVPTWKSALPPQVKDRSDAGAGEVWVIFADNYGFGKRLAKHLTARGHDVLTVEAGAEYGGGLKDGFTVCPDEAADYHRLVADLGGQNKTINRVIHAWAVSEDEGGPLTPQSFEAYQRHTFFSLMYLARALGTLKRREPLPIKVLSTQMHEVLHGDAVDPRKAPVLALCKVIPQEFDSLTCSSIDLGAPGTAIEDGDGLWGLLEEELLARIPGAVVAYRRGQRWLQAFDSIRLSEGTSSSGDGLSLRERGVYLISGGLGGMGFVLAACLTKKVKARLVLTGRSELPPESQWGAWIEAHGQADPTSLKIRRIQALREEGAEVLYVSADAARLEDMAGTMAQAEKQFGQIHGVVHGAGIVSGRTFRSLDELEPSDCDTQFQPKVQGLLVLEQVLADRPLDFCLLSSSLSSVLGGLSYGAYAAANVFMDAFAQAHNQRSQVKWLSVNWDEWRFVASVDVDSGRAGMAKFAITPSEGAAAFARILNLRGATQVVVSTRDLQARLDEWISLRVLRKETEEKAKESAPRHARPDLQNAYVAPTSPAEQKITQIWQDMLGIEKVGIHDNFFDLGGHSLMGIQLISRLKTEFDKPISVATLFEGPTVHSLCKLLEPDEEGKPASLDTSRDRGLLRKEKRQQRGTRRKGRTSR